MSLKARNELLTSTISRYLKAPKAKKQRILDEFTASTGYHRKYAIALFNRATTGVHERRRSQRPVQYGPEVQSMLVVLWEAAYAPNAWFRLFPNSSK